MDIAIQTPPEQTSFAALRDLWQAADELGVRAAFTFDHLVPLAPGQRPGLDVPVPPGPQLEGWVTLSALAACTRNLEVGTLVTGVTYRHPSVLAKMAVTLDHVSDGRAILGLGAGWHQVEHEMFGLDFPPVGDRMTLLDEALDAFHRLCTEDEVTTTGRHVRLSGARFEPKPVRPGGIPVLVGGTGPRLRRIAARHATMFNTFVAPWDWPAVNAALDADLAAVGRRPDELERTAFVATDLSGTATGGDALVDLFRATRGGTEEEVRARVLVGDPEQMAEVLRAYAAAGVSMVVLSLRAPYEVAGLERFARDVLPAVI